MSRKVEQRNCDYCNEVFTPKSMGFNAKYCSPRCKKKFNLKKRPKIYRADKRQESWEKTRQDPEKYANHLTAGRRFRAKTREWLVEYKTSRGCIDCGYNKHFSALQLDHTGAKSIEIAHARTSIAKLEKEIKDGQCVVRCANCHSIKTWERKQKSEDYGRENIK